MVTTIIHRTLGEETAEPIDISKYMSTGDCAALSLKLTVWPADGDGFHNPAPLLGVLTLPWSQDHGSVVVMVQFLPFSDIFDQPSHVEVKSYLLYGLNTVNALCGTRLTSSGHFREDERATGHRSIQVAVIDFSEDYSLVFGG